MPSHLSIAVKESIRALLLEGKKDQVTLTIVDKVGTSIQTVKNYSANLKNFGDIECPRIRPHGHRPLLTCEMGDMSSFHKLRILQHSYSNVGIEGIYHGKTLLFLI